MTTPVPHRQEHVCWVLGGDPWEEAHYPSFPEALAACPDDTLVPWLLDEPCWITSVGPDEIDFDVWHHRTEADAWSAIQALTRGVPDVSAPEPGDDQP